MKFKSNIKGRISNFDLKDSDAFIPFIEGVVNSIHAIQEAEESKGTIDIFIEKKYHGLKVEGTEVVSSIEIIDNGIGFNKENFDSFITEDSNKKMKIGGKGIGRFTWLKAFDIVEIESNFMNKFGKLDHKVFDFSINKKEEINLKNKSPKNLTGRKTSVKLNHFKLQFAQNFPTNIIDICNLIINNCTQYFLSAQCPIITIYLGDEKKQVNKVFKKKFHKNIVNKEVEVKLMKFKFTHMRKYGENEKNTVKLCAHNRVVKTYNLEKKIPNLKSCLEDIEGEKYIYTCYIESEFLNRNVASNRTKFNISKTGTSELFERITYEDIERIYINEINNHLKEELEKIEFEKINYIEKLTKNDLIKFRHVTKMAPEKIKNIKPNLSLKLLTKELAVIDFELALKLKEECKKVLKCKTHDENQFKTMLTKYISKLNEKGKSSLAEYVVSRKVTLEMFQEAIELDNNGNYHLEKVIHNYIFPMNSDSEEVRHEDSNLWMIDERLAYHRFLRSDKPISKEDSSRPDIIISNNTTYVSRDRSPYDSFTIIEFKRPGKDRINPIEQVLNYVRKLKDNKMKKSNGRLIEVDGNSRFYCYIICDNSSKLDDIIANYDFCKTPDGYGRYLYNKSLNTYVEIIPFNKLITDAESRNRILFDKLGIN